MRTRQKQKMLAACKNEAEREALQAKWERLRLERQERRAKILKMTPEERKEFEIQESARVAAIARENGKRGGRPLGSLNADVEALQATKFRVKAEYKDIPEAVAYAGMANKRIFDVMMGKVFSRKAPSVLKAALAVRQEICEPVAQEHHHSGGISLTHAVAQAAGRIPTTVSIQAQALKALDSVPRAVVPVGPVVATEAKPVEAEVVPIKKEGA